MITAAEARALLDKVRRAAEADDYEDAHLAEDDLRTRVLAAIADGATNPVELAHVALATADLKFARWCA